MTDIALRVENLGKKYIIGHQKSGDLRGSVENKFKNLFGRSDRSEEEFWALRDINFELKQGEAVGIIGRNGAGKSTLLKILSRITDPTIGRFDINGRVSSLLEVGTGFHSELTGRENIFLNGTILGMKRSEIKAKFDQIVDFSGVEKFLDTPVKHYSSGMKVRLAFSVAAHLEPEILIVDEVLAVGDAEFQKKCLGKMDEVSKMEGRTVLFVSHNMSAVESLCTKGIILNEGSISFLGPTEETVKLYLSNLDNSLLRESWKKSNKDENKLLEITEVQTHLSGKQPQLKLEIDCTLSSNSDHQPSFIAFDVLLEDATPIFQAIPTEEKIIKWSENVQNIKSVIDLPPLIPGIYRLSVWVGSHYFETYDWQQEIISFNIDNSPMINRTHPHSKRNGFLVPYSSIIE